MNSTLILPIYSKLPLQNKPLNEWVFKIIGPYIKGRVLELNGGMNSLCPLFIQHNRPIHLNDSNIVNMQKLKDNYAGIEIVHGVHGFDFFSAHFQQQSRKEQGAFDTVIALKLSIEQFQKIVSNIKYTLPKGGTLVLIFPVHNFLYGGLDENLGDWKKYNGRPIRQILDAGFTLLKVRYFNLRSEEQEDGFAHYGLSALGVFTNIN